jgi:transposase
VNQLADVVPMASNRRKVLLGEPGVDLLRIRGASILTWFRTWKGSATGDQVVPCESLAAYRLALYLEYHPLVRYFQRADVARSFADEHRLDYLLPFPLAIPYVLDGGRHEYYPDFMGLLEDGRLFLAEAGLAADKTKPEAQAKAMAAADYALAEGGEYWIGTSAHISDVRFDSLKMLHAGRLVHSEPDGLADALRDLFTSGSISVRQVVGRLSASFPPELVEATAWRLLGEAHARGRLLFDFDDKLLTISSPVRIRGADRPALLPPRLPAALKGESIAHVASVDAPGRPVIDAGSIDDERKRDRFRRNVGINAAIREGHTPREIGSRFGVSSRMVRYLKARYAQLGELAFVPNATYQREDPVDPAFRRRIEQLIRSSPRLSAQAIAEGPELPAVARKLSNERQAVVPTPSVSQVRRIRRELRELGVELDRREKGHKPRRWAGGGAISHVHRIPYPGALAEVDEHYMDVLVAVDEYDVAIRVYAGVLVDVKTGCPLSAVLSPVRLTEGDFTRLVKMALEPKDRLKARYGFENEWPCTVKVAAIASDNAWNFISKRARDVLVTRLNITEAIVPPGAPSAKGTAESILGFVTRRFGHRLPGTLMDNPEHRADYDSEAEALRRGLTFDELEAFFYRALVDGYLQDWDDTRGGQRVALWRAAVAELGAPQFTGSADELKLLLLKAVNRKNTNGTYRVHHGGVYFLQEWYRSSAEDVARAIRNHDLEVYYDPRDIVTIYIGLRGQIIGSLTAPRLLKRYGRISQWELEQVRKRERPARRRVKATTGANMRRLYGQAAVSRRDRKRAAQTLERARAHDTLASEIHVSDVIADRARALRGDAAPAADASVGPERHGPDNVIPVARLPVRRLPVGG